MARRGESVAQMVREIRDRVAPAKLELLELMKYFKEAFHLSIGQVKPICGWYPDGWKECSDVHLNDYLWPEIVANQDKWDQGDKDKGNECHEAKKRGRGQVP
jgi:hypothetical protein